MTEHCCHNMGFFNRTHDEHLVTLAKVGANAAEVGEPPEPLVEFRHGVYVIGNVAIAYCPWCGTKLPSLSVEDLRKLGYKKLPESG
jgi:hypothetical protein